MDVDGAGTISRIPAAEPGCRIHGASIQQGRFRTCRQRLWGTLAGVRRTSAFRHSAHGKDKAMKRIRMNGFLA